MEFHELCEILKLEGLRIGRKIFDKSIYHLEALDLLYSGRLLEWSIKDKQGLAQPSANFGPARQIMVEEALVELNIDAKICEGLLDVLICEKYDSEVRGSFTHSDRLYYNDPNSGKLQINVGKKLHFLILHKINLHAGSRPYFTSMKLLAIYIDSSMFEHVASKAQNRSTLSLSKLKKEYSECIIGEWEIFNEEVS